jgi:hypothetical protein
MDSRIIGEREEVRTYRERSSGTGYLIPYKIRRELENYVFITSKRSLTSAIYRLTHLHNSYLWRYKNCYNLN